MNLIERYITEIGKHLPAKNRSDIQTEIKSTLEDILEDRSHKEARPVDDEMVKAVLQDYGAPEEVAKSYLPERYLIGPRLYPTFIMVLKIVLSVLTGLALMGFGIRFGTSAQTAEAFMSIFGKTLAEYITGILSAFGNIVFIFAILQWTLPASEFEDGKKKSWDPAELEKEPEPDEVSFWGPAWSIALTVAALLVFNLYPQVIGIGYMDGGKWTFVPALSKAFFRYLPAIDVLWVLQIVLQMMLLRQGRWTTLTRWFNAGLTLMGIVIGFMMLTGPSLVNLDEAVLAHVIPDLEAVGNLVKIFGLIPIIVLGIVVVLESIDLVKDIVRLVIKPKDPLRLIQK